MKTLVKTKNSVFLYVLSFIFRTLYSVYGLLGLIAWVASLWFFHYGFTGHDGGFMMKWFWGNMYSAIPGLVALALFLKSLTR